MKSKGYLTQPEIKALMEDHDDPLVIRPLLESNQIGNISIDFRVGYDFYVSVQGRSPYIHLSNNPPTPKPSMKSFFQATRKKMGETFLLHPGQTVLSSSLEYVKLPKNVFLTLSMRSSYSRLGLSLSTIVQPGYCGCISIEFTNITNHTLNLTVGARIFQARVSRVDQSSNYFSKTRKYMCQVRPQLSAADRDPDLSILHEIWKENHNIISETDGLN